MSNRCTASSGFTVLLIALITLFAACGEDASNPTGPAKVRQTSDWSEYGGTNAQRHATVDQITKENVKSLKKLWTYRTGDVADGEGEYRSTSAFEVTPILVDGLLIFCTPFNRIIALDPLTGAEAWSFDPGIDETANYSNQLVCRGVSHWVDSELSSDNHCASRIISATNDSTIVAIDAHTGEACTDFGNNGLIDLHPAEGETLWKGEHHITSPPAIIGDLAITGAAISDNVRTDAPSGVIRAFDVRSGKEVWTWDVAPPDFDYETGLTNSEGHALGTPNVWGVIAADPERDLIFAPTGNPSPDYYRTGTPEMDHFGSSIVAIRASTGDVVWHFRTTIHDFWDFDVGAQPSLIDLRVDGKNVPAVAQATKTGFIFILNRETGEPLFPVEYRDVPTEGPLKDMLSPVQPFPPEAFQVAHMNLEPDKAWGLTFWDRGQCRKILEDMRTGDIYLPITEEYTAVLPSNLGGINWGGVSIDPERQLLIVRNTNTPFKVRLIPREEFGEAKGAEFGTEYATQRGMPFAMSRAPILSPIGVPCNPPPWGTLTAIDLNTGQQLWQKPHGGLRDMAPVPIPWEIGMPGIGAPMTTSSGLIFIGAAMDNFLRAYDTETGDLLWKGRLPASPQATPMSYTVEDDSGQAKQIVIIAAGGHGRANTTLGDHLIAYGLPD